MKRIAVYIKLWGDQGTIYNRDRDILGLLTEPHYFGLTEKGNPKHPLYVPKNVVPRKFENHKQLEKLKLRAKQNDQTLIQKQNHENRAQTERRSYVGKNCLQCARFISKKRICSY
ncbi:MAG: hypothetical protein R6V15_07695 [Desulfotignum sp.]